MRYAPARPDRGYRAAALLVTLALGSCATAEVARRGPGYIAYEVGNSADVIRPTRGLWVLQGGGDDVDQNYIRMGEYGGGGDFVVLRASGKNDYNDYIFAHCRCNSVTTLVFDGGAAMTDPYVVETIRNAEAIFIAGGDQSNYIRYWKDTPVEDAINFVAAKPAPIGGTSAGMAVLGEYVYSAEGEESLTSTVAMNDPFAPDLTLARDFLRLRWLENLITDQHLQERDRIGRTVTLLSRLQNDGWSAAPRAIAADRETSVHVDPADGTARVFSTADHPTPYVYFLSAVQKPERCAAATPLVAGPIRVYRLGPGGHFDLSRWRGSGGVSYELRASGGRLQSSRGDAYGQSPRPSR